MQFNTDIDIKDRKRTTLSDFRGVDTANPVYNVDFRRATAMRNFININGSNHKRAGWRQIARFKDSSGNSLAINGVFRFTIAKEEFRIVYAGTKFFIYDTSTETYIDLLNLMVSQNQSCANKVDETRLKDQEIQMFVFDDKAYFIGCGDYLVFGMYNGKPEIRRVYNDENTYIPRTTTNISPNEADVDGSNNPVVYADRSTDRDVNILTKYRTNELIGSSYASSESERTYNLDTTDIDTNDFSVKVNDYNSGTGVSTEYDLVVGEVSTETRNLVVGDDLAGKTILFDTSVHIFGAFRESTFDSSVPLLSAGVLRIYADAQDALWNTVFIYSKLSGVRTKIATATRSNSFNSYSLTWHLSSVSVPSGVSAITTLSSKKAKFNNLNFTAVMPTLRRDLNYGTGESAVKWGEIDFKNGIFTLVKAAHSIAGEPNIIIKLSKTVAEDTEKMLNCRFGTLFGTNGNANVLFVSGNKDLPNIDLWSSAEDFTYFPSGNLCEVGTPNNKIMSYQRLGDDSLAIFKSESTYEPTLYIRTGVASSVDSEGEVKEGYFVTAGKFITQGAVSEQATAMLGGDPLFLSKLGVFGVAISSDTSVVDQRVARERSRFINALLAKHTDLSTATAIVYNNRYYLAIEDAVYVADARWTFTAKGDMSDTYNYEWWVWDNCPIKHFYEIDNELCFGTEDGRICVFDEEYTDRTYEQLTSATFDVANNRVYGDGSVELATDDLVYFKGTSIYRLLFAASAMTVSDNKITVSESNILKVEAGQYVYADTVAGTGLVVDTKYVIGVVDAGACNFTLTTVDGSAVSITAAGFRLFKDLSEDVLKITVATDGDNLNYFTCKNLYNSEAYTIAQYNGETISANVFKYIKENVVSEWYTPVMDMGTNDYVKTLLGLTIATEQITNGNISFGWETKSLNGLVNLDAKGLDVFDFSNLNFDRFAFDTGFSTSFSRSVKAGFNFIIFRFISDNEYDSCVSSFTITYKINRKNKGVW